MGVTRTPGESSFAIVAEGRPTGKEVLVRRIARRELTVMAWIESHQELGAHPKTQKLARLLGISRPAAVGHLQFLWWWAMDYAQDGALDRFEPIDIAIGGEWDGEPEAFLDALIRAGFVDEEGAGLRIHDWDEYAGRLLEKRRQDADRKRRARNVQRTSNGHDAGIRETALVTVPNRTEPNQTVPNQVGREGDSTRAASPPLSSQAVTFPCDDDTNVSFAFADGDSGTVEVTFGQATDEVPNPPPEKRTQKRATGIPTDFAPTDEQYEWADKEFGLSRSQIDWETGKFLDYHRAKGSTQKDWWAAWRYWIRKSAEYSRPQGSIGADQPTLQNSRASPPLSKAAKAKQQVDYLRQKIAEEEGHDENRSSEIGGHYPYRMAASGR